MKILKRIAKIISTIIFSFLCVIIVLILFYVGRIAYLTSQNRIGDIKVNFYTILTQSMYPNVKAGDIVITYKNEDGIYKKGDVITFVSAGSNTSGITVTHRIVDMTKKDGVNFYKTKGDNNNVSDSSLVPSGNIFGKVVLVIPKAGNIQQFLVTKTGWVVMIVLPCLGIVIYDILKAFKVFGKKGVKKKTKQERYVIDVDNNVSSEQGEDISSLDNDRLVIPLEEEIPPFDMELVNNEIEDVVSTVDIPSFDEVSSQNFEDSIDINYDNSNLDSGINIPSFDEVFDQDLEPVNTNFDNLDVVNDNEVELLEQDDDVEILDTEEEEIEIL